MSDRFRDLLSDYLDHDLPRAEHAAVERHLESCAECREALAGIASVKSHAASLVDPPAPSDLWAEVASRIGTAGSANVTALPQRASAGAPDRAPTWGPGRWLGVAAAFAMVTAAALWLAHDRLSPAMRPAPMAAGANGEALPSVAARGTLATPAGFDPARIEGEIGELEQALARGRGELDPKTVAVLESNLRIIRQATEDARRALEQDPANRALRDYLAGSVQRKFDLVRRAAELAGV